MSPDWVARGIAASSLAVALIGLAWSVISWTRSGPHLRVQALIYREQLELRISNAGRTPNTVANVIMNGRPDSDRVIGLADQLQLPWRLEPGQSRTVILEHTDTHLAPWWRFARGGWSDVWVLAGSMHQHHIAIIPVDADRSPQHGWRFPPRFTVVRRWLPLFGGAPLLYLASNAGADDAVRILVIFAVAGVLWRAGTVSPASAFARRRVERWTLAGAVALSVLALVLAADREPWTPIPTWEVFVPSVYAIGAWFLGRAGGPVAIRHLRTELGDLADIVRSKFRRSPATSENP